MLSKREIQIRSVSRRLGDKRIIAFIRAAKDDDVVIAMRIANRALKGRASLENVFFPRLGDTDERRRDYRGLFLRAKKQRTGSYNITLGYATGGLEGDGGVWSVTFRGDRVAEIELLERWIG